MNSYDIGLICQKCGSGLNSCEYRPDEYAGDTEKLIWNCNRCGFKRITETWEFYCLKNNQSVESAVNAFLVCQIPAKDLYHLSSVQSLGEEEQD